MMGARKEMPLSPKHQTFPHLARVMPREGRSDHHGGIELHGVQRDGVGHVLLVDQGGDERGVGRAAEGLP